ncbi:MAG TPA: hypothetical protein VK879_02360, partial [Candidatus Sulfomarinibacteraceae bacterium]|nr:hypothetical protein [Candidatus Sulfomarinibacteraceae bacterium]
MALFAAVPARAQQDEGAPAAVDAAVSALNQAIPGIGQPQRFTYSFLTPTADSALGCPLTQGFDLGRQVTPYRIMLFYPDARYTYHATADGSIVIPCDEQLPIGGPLPLGEQPYTPASPVEAVISSFLRSFPERQFPTRFQFTFG